MVQLTERQKEIVERLDDGLCTVEFLEEWLNKEFDVLKSPFAVLQRAVASGFLRSVKRIEERKEMEALKSERHD